MIYIDDSPGKIDFYLYHELFLFERDESRDHVLLYCSSRTPIVRSEEKSTVKWRSAIRSGQHPRHHGWGDLSSTTDSNMINLAVLFAIMKIYRAPSNSRKLPSNAGPLRKNASAVSCAGLLIFYKRNALVAPRQHASSLTGSSSP